MIKSLFFNILLVFSLLGNQCPPGEPGRNSTEGTTHTGRDASDIAHVDPETAKGFPPQLLGIDFADSPKVGMVIKAKTLTIEGGHSLFNSSIVANDDYGFLMSVRWDESNGLIRNSKMGLVELDEHFDPIGKITGLFHMQGSRASEHAEDPRLVRVNGRIHIVFNDFPPVDPDDSKIGSTPGMFHGVLNSTAGGKRTIKDVRFLDAKNRPTEKNWIPFDNNGALSFVYAQKPHTILASTNLLLEGRCDWELAWKWGEVRGGTPALLVEHEGKKEYLTFFHSYFINPANGGRWYVFGAYTFNPQKEYCITSISRFPILFKGIYSSANQSSPWKVVFPGGFVATKIKNRDVYVVSVGENDKASKLVFIDKEKLFENLAPVKSKGTP